MEDITYAYWLANISGISPRVRLNLYEQCKSAREIWNLSGEELKKQYGVTEEAAVCISRSKAGWDPGREWERLQERGISFVSMEQDTYPKRLRNLYDPPFGLYYIGRLPKEDAKSVGIVGGRACSRYGQDMAKRSGKCMALNGVSVISGMARGIDGYGHEGALDGGGSTYAVLGCGVNVVYPPEHASLYERIIAHGGVLSEYPPDTRPHPGYFPMRNRIIAGLSDLLLIIEAKEKSGSLITADCALEQGKDIFAAPGRMTDPLSAGCNRLIRQGAGILLSPEELVGELGLLQEKNKLLLEKSERLVYSCLDLLPKSMEKISEETALDIATLAEILFSLEEKGLVREAWQNHYISVN
ncbi:MAG: DNA-processing protein DprA [bacterium]|nr:DNA-processing protein DprA [bacterium]MDY4100762.1 DNA-processing protein DprA [Lachnospiraceae bacterium]